MRCPSCGASNADDALACVECGARLAPVSDDIDEQVEGSPDWQPADVARKLEEETRLIQEETRLMTQETTLLEDEMLERSGSRAAMEADVPETPERPAQERPAQPEPEKTVVRPMTAQTEQHFVVRNTRDYDHDAQSVNLAGDASNFETLHAEESPRKLRRDPYERSARKGRVPGEGNSRSKLRPFLAILLVALVLGGGFAVLTYGMQLWGGKVVPSVTAESQANAEARLRDKGLVAKVETVLADDAIGKVVSQDPEAGVRVPEGSEVTIRIATNRTIPQVLGLTEEEASALLAEVGAEHVSVNVVPSQEWDGTVIGVSPDEGSVFVSRQDVILTVAGQYHVPDVIGKKESDALDLIADAGLNAHVTYVSSSQTVRTVVETSPAPGEVIHSSGTVEVMVSSPYPSDPYHLAEFFNHSSQDVDAFLDKEEFSLQNGFIDNHGNALAVYSSSGKGKITFSSQPYMRYLTFPKKGSTNVLSTGAPIAGVRLELPSSEVPNTADKEAVEKIAKLCGLENLKDICDVKTITVPSGTGTPTATFCCGSGTMDGVVWTVLVVSGNGTTRASVTCAREGLYPASELSQTGGKVCDYVAYQEVYKSGEYWPKKETTDDTKDPTAADQQPGDASQQQGDATTTGN